MSDNLKMPKKEKIMSILLVLLLLLFSFVVIFVVSNKKNEIVEEKPIDESDANNYVVLENIDNTPYLSIYKSVNLKKVKFNAITEILVSNFYIKQDEYLNKLSTSIDSNKQFIEKYNIDNNIGNYAATSKIDSIILYDVKDNVLSVLYLIEDDVDYIGLNNYITNIFIDLKNNSVLDTNTLLDKYGLTKEEISSKILDSILEKHKEKIVNKNTKEEITLTDIQKNKENYVKNLIDNFDKYVYFYFYQDNLYLKYNRNEIINNLFNEDLNSIFYSTLKLDINK